MTDITEELDTAVNNGIAILCDSYLAIKPTDHVLVLTSGELDNPESQLLLARLRDQLAKQVASVHVEPAGPYDERELDGYDLVALASMTISVHRTEILRYLGTGRRHQRIYRLFNFSPELFKLALAVEQSTLNALNESIIRAARTTRVVRVTNCSGTDLTIELVPDGGWTNSCGLFAGRFPAVLPPGEVNTYSPYVTGVVVGDGALNSSFGFPGDPRLVSHPVKLLIEDSRVLDCSCHDPVTSQVLSAFLGVDNADRVGEVGFGTNEGITEWVGFVSHINERHPGLHLGLGTSSQTQDKVGWSCPLHLDVILDQCTILFGDVPVFHDGRWDSAALHTLAGAEPMPEVLPVDAV